MRLVGDAETRGLHVFLAESSPPIVTSINYYLACEIFAVVQQELTEGGVI